MAEENQERTEEATPKRRSESKDKGQVAIKPKHLPQNVIRTIQNKIKVLLKYFPWK